MCSSRPALISILVSLAWLSLAFPAHAQPTADRPELAAGDWDAVLRTYARGGLFDYAAFSADPEAKARLARFIRSAANMRPEAGLASWLNVYNAVVVHDASERLPLSSVRDHDDFFSGARHRIAGQLRSLDAIENRLIRPRFKDARVHAALNCGARGCPPLHPRAFRAAHLGATLNRLAAGFIASRVHVHRGELRVSKIFEWYRADFEASAGSLIAWIKRFDRRHRLDTLPPTAPIRFATYDWRLNQSRPRPHP